MRPLAAAALALFALAAAGEAPAGSAERAAPACDAKRSAKRLVARRACRARGAHVGTARAGAGAGPQAWRAAPSLAHGGQAPGPVTATSPGPAGAPAPTPTPTAGYTPPPPPPDDPAAVRVSATEFALTLSRPAVRAGAVRVEFDNSRAEDPHDLVVDPDGAGESLYFGQLGPGEVQTQTLELSAGTYTLSCSLLDHEQLGMRARLTAD